jgi:hypothetical protein
MGELPRWTALIVTSVCGCAFDSSAIPGARDAQAARDAAATPADASAGDAAAPRDAAGPPSGVAVKLWWDNDGDFDLHLVRDRADPPSGRRWNDRTGPACQTDSQCSLGPCDPATHRCTGTGNDCYGNDLDPDWGLPDPTNNQACLVSADCRGLRFSTCRGLPGSARCVDTADDPRLLMDVTGGGGPEVIEMTQPPAGTYHLGVDHFPNNADASKGNATVHVFVDGVEIYGEGLVDPVSLRLAVNDFWYVGRLVVAPVRADTKLLPEPTQPGAARPCSTGANPCHRDSATDYPAIP